MHEQVLNIKGSVVDDMVPPDFNPKYVLVKRKVINGTVAIVYGFRPDSISHDYITFFIFFKDFMWQCATLIEVIRLLKEIGEQQTFKP
jgi:hypothetical protein